MNRPLGIVLVVVGIVFLVMSYNASQSVSSEVSKFFTGDFSDRTLWMLVAGVAAAAGGIALVVLPGRRASN